MLDDGRTYANPIIGGYQGAFEVVPESRTHGSYVRTLAGKAVFGVDEEGYVQSAADPYEAPPRRGLDPGSFEEAARTDDPQGEATTTDLEPLYGGFPMELDEFIAAILDSLDEIILEPRVHIGETSGPGGFRFEPPNVGGSAESADEEVPFGEEPPSTDVPRGTVRADFSGASGGVLSTEDRGGTLGACGWYDLHLTMQQVPTDWWSYPINDSCMWMWNQFMDVYRYIASDGTYGNNNGENEFCGWVNDADLNSVYGYTWGSGIAMCVTWSYSGCGEITESDIMWNPAYSWTSNEDFALGNFGVILLRPVAMHELGHSWGMQRKTYVETYDYDQPTVMHAYYHDVVENGRGIHFPEAYCIREIYDDQTSITSFVDVGVESYYASNGLNNSTTNAATYYPGNSITLQNVTVENMSNSAVSDVRLRFYLSTNNIISTGDYQMGSYWYWTSFPAEAHNVGNYTTTIPSSIPAGTYYVGAIVTINGYNSDDYGSNNSTFFYNTITILSPQLCRSPSSLDFGTSSTSKTFQAWNCSGGTLSYSISDNRSWIGVSPTSGSSTGELDTITVTVNRSGLSPGHYTGTVTIDPNYGSNQYVTVDMDVPEPDPQLCKSISSMNCETYSGGSFTVWNCGGGTLTYAVSDNRTWMSVSPTSGSSTGEYDTITVDIDRTGLAPGHYSGAVTIDPNYGSNQYVTVDMDVPGLSRSPGSLDFDSTLTNLPFEVWNCGGGTLSYTVSDDRGWMSVSPTSGSSTGEHDTITVTVNRSGLSPGGYSGTVTIDPDYGSNQYVTVTLHVAPDPTEAAFRVESDGTVLLDKTFYAEDFLIDSADVAEWVSVSETVGPGDVVELDPTTPAAYRRSQGACSALIAGVISTEPGVVLGEAAAFEQRALLALTGIVPVKVTDEGGPIRPGDLLVSSSTPGHAMRWAGDGPCSCAFLGKALEPMTAGTGLILVLLMAH